MAEQSDPVADILKGVKTTDAIRASAWDAFHEAANEDELANRLKQLPLAPNVKADLWDLKSKQMPTVATSSEQAQTTTPERIWGDTASDVGIGVMKGAARTALDAGALVRRIPGVGATSEAIGNAIGGGVSRVLYGTSAQPVSGDDAFKQARQDTRYTNLPQMVGGAIETTAELAAPLIKGAQAIPTTAKAGAKFQQVMAAAREMPIDVSKPGQVALRIQELAERGGSMPMAVRKFLNRVTDPEKAALTYEESRDFASNISRLSANEYQRLTPVVAREVANLRVTLNAANAEAAKKVGMMKEYAEAMREYHRAMQIRDTIGAIVEGAKRSVPYATAAGAGYWLTSKLRNLMAE